MMCRCKLARSRTNVRDHRIEARVTGRERGLERHLIPREERHCMVPHTFPLPMLGRRGTLLQAKGAGG